MCAHAITTAPPPSHNLASPPPTHTHTHTQVHFKLREPGFLRVYEGTWRITPAGAAALNLPTAGNSGSGVVDGGVDGAEGPSGLCSNSSAVPAKSPSPAPAASRRLSGGLFGGAAAGLLASMHNPLLDLQGRVLQGLPAQLTTAAAGPPGSTSTHSAAGLWEEPTTSRMLLGGPGGAPDHAGPTTPSAGGAVQPQLGGRQRAVVRVEGLSLCPTVGPPYPLGGLLKGHAQGQVSGSVSQ